MQKPERILLADDEEGILTLLEITLKKERFMHITSCMTGREALALVQQNSYDLIVLDVMLPDMNGFDLCSRIRRHTTAPIIFITSCASDLDKITGLGIGGDDYITKPFNPLEVVARIQALLRRQSMLKSGPDGQPEAKEYRFGSFLLKPDIAKLIIDGKELDCTAKELQLLIFFCSNPNRIFTASQIYEYVWGEPGFGVEKTIAMHISNLRKKIESNPKEPATIMNLRGIGYKFVPPGERCP
ncbi:response regulator transcription factor [Paenibacillus sp. YYML68]|uniref:response regulator transcription factor n=1 Tax=Paenibacillus sp. YYML68 TaxID=2909250 RepID=UPI00249033BB|nr:response regulator transcription factor [Paenibacillus sp. YYML68]